MSAFYQPWCASHSPRSTFLGCAARGMKFPFTPKRAYLSLKKKFVTSASVWSSFLLVPFSEPDPKFDENEVELVGGDVSGAWTVVDEICKLVAFCWFKFPFPFPFPFPLALFDWRPNPWRLETNKCQQVSSELPRSHEAHSNCSSYNVQ